MKDRKRDKNIFLLHTKRINGDGKNVDEETTENRELDRLVSFLLSPSADAK